MKKLLAAATAAGLLTLGAGGTAFAQSDGGSGSSTSTTAPAADSSKAGQTPGQDRRAARRERAA